MSIQTDAIGNYTAKKDKKISGVGATFAAYGAATTVEFARSKVNRIIHKKSIAYNRIASDYISIFHNTGEKALEKVGLADKIKIQYLAKEEAGLADKIKIQCLAKEEAQIDKLSNSAGSTLTEIGKFFKSIIKNMLNPNRGMIEAVKNGDNAFYLGKTPMKDRYTKEVLAEAYSIILSKEAGATDIFHEIGHAMNDNLSKIGHLRIQSIGRCGQISSLLLLYSLFSRKSKPDENGKYTILQKTNNFIRNNAGTLTFATFLPQLTEEGMASIKGYKLAKNFLSPDLLKMYSKSSKYAFLTYAALACFSAIGVHAAVKIKDKVIERKEAKLAKAQTS